MRHSEEISLFTESGERKYLTPDERIKFIECSKLYEREKRSFLLMLANTGMRISEVLSLTISSIDVSAKSVIVETLKQRRKGVYRSVPLSDEFINELNLIHEVRKKQKSKKGRNENLWSFTRRTGGRYVDDVMNDSGITGARACPKALRHSFAVSAVLKQIPIVSIQKWLGHSSLDITAIYLQVSGEEERALASRLW